MRLYLVPRLSASASGLVSTKYKVWDTLSKPHAQKVDLKAGREDRCGRKYLTWYTCGPTVYDASHLGHATCYIRLDIIRRILERRNDCTVLQVMNITNIDDKIIKRANEASIPWDVLSKKFEAEFLREMDLLNVKRPQIVARVTDFMPEIVDFVSTLLSKGLAYTTSDNSVYFDSKAYGKCGVFVQAPSDVSRQDGAKDQEKKHASDFCLWKGQKPGEPFWNAPWGKGRPGWHIECSAVAGKFFGSTLDIHAGGCDLIFPHHENEESQCRAYYGIDRWVRHWIHTGHMIINQHKMSKSLRNFITIEEFLKSNSADVLRMLCMSHYYRSHLYYSDDEVRIAKSNLEKCQEFLNACNLLANGVLEPRNTRNGPTDVNLWEELEGCKSKIEERLCDDFDLPGAKTLLMDFVHTFNNTVLEGSKVDLDFSVILASKEFVTEFLQSLGFFLQRSTAQIASSKVEFDSILEEIVEFRSQVRNFSLAFDEGDKQKQKEMRLERAELVEACDKIRIKMKEYGVDIKDHKMKSSWSLKS